MKQKLIQFAISTLLLALLSWIGEYFIAWWMIAIVAFMVHVFYKMKAILAFFSGFLAIFFLWMALSFYIHHQTHGILTVKMGAILGIQGEGTTLVLISALIGALVGGFSALTGNYFRKLIDNYPN